MQCDHHSCGGCHANEDCDMEDKEVMTAEKFEEFVRQPLATNPKIVQGVCPNGFQYVILENSYPPNRFEAHLQLRVGSLNETEAEQGIAHFVEHVVFLGTEKYPGADIIRERLAKLGMAWGADTNAHTDFRNTMFTFFSPAEGVATGPQQAPVTTNMSNLHQVIDIFFELLFKALIREENVQSERSAVLSELQLRNNIEYRTFVQAYRQLYSETMLPDRLPIGKEEQIKSWSAADLLRFYKTWYRPDLMTLFIVGTIKADEAVSMISSIFGAVPPPLDVALPVKPIRPEPIVHKFGQVIEPAVKIFQHELIQQVTVTFTLKLPLTPVQILEDKYWQLVDTIIGHALDARVEVLLHGTVDGPAPFTNMGWDYLDSGLEGCGTNSYTVMSQPQEWRQAVTIAVREAHRLAKYGLTPDELQRSAAIFMKDSLQNAEQNDTMPSDSLIDHIMNEVDLACAVQDYRQQHDDFVKLLPFLDLEEVNSRCAELFNLVTSFVDAFSYSAAAHLPNSPVPPATDPFEAHFPAPLPNNDPEANGQYYLRSPASVFITGPTSYSTNNEKVVLSLDECEFVSVVKQALAAGIDPPKETEVPEDLVAPEAIKARVNEIQPSFVPVDDPVLKRWTAQLTSSDPTETPTVDTASKCLWNDTEPQVEFIRLERDGTRVVDDVSGVRMMQLSNGMRINYKKTDFERKQFVIRLVAKGGRTLEKRKLFAPDGTAIPTRGAVPVGMRLLLEGGAGPFPPQVLSKWCGVHQIGCTGGVDMERVMVQVSGSVTDGGLDKAFQLLHLVLQQPRSALDLAPVFHRIIKEECINWQMLQRSPEKTSMNEMFKISVQPFDDPRLCSTPEADFQKLSLDLCRLLLAEHFHKLECVVVGDFDPPELEAAILSYLGTLSLTVPPELTTPQAVEVQLPALQGQPPPPVVPAHHALARTSSLLGTPRKGSAVTTSTSAAVEASTPPTVDVVKLSVQVAKVEGEPDYHLEFNREQCKTSAHIVDDEQHAVVFVSYPSANKWGRGPVNTDVPEVRAVDEASSAKRAHKLYVCRTLSLVSEIINNRLFQVLREQKSLLYAVHFSYIYFDFADAGISHLSLAPFPNKVTETINEAFTVLSDLKAGTSITPQEFEEAHGPLVASCHTGLSSNDFWLSALMHLHTSSSPKDLRCLRQLPEYYSQLTLDDALYVLRKYIRLDLPAVSIVTTGPEKP